MEEPNREARHPIGVVAERTGLTPEVLRVWERRYDVVRPVRSEGGQRLYSDDDVGRLRLLRQASQAGRSIGSIARLPHDELARLVREDEAARLARPADGEETPATALEVPLAHALALDADALEAHLDRAAAVLGAPVFLERVAAPFMRLVGDEWHAGRLTPAHEHLATGVVQRVVLRVMTALREGGDAPAFLVATPVDERHEIGALLAAAAAAAEGWRVIYLGASLPAAEIAAAAAATGADAVGVSVIVAGSPARVSAELATLRARLPASVPLFVGGAGARAIEPDPAAGETIRVHDLDELRAALRRRAPLPAR